MSSILPSDAERERQRRLEGAREYHAQETERIKSRRKLVRAALDSGDRRGALILAHGGSSGGFIT